MKRTRTSGELEALGIKNQQLVVNAVFEATDDGDAVAIALEQRGQRRRCARYRLGLRDLPTMRIPLRAFNMVGLPALRALLDDRAPPRLWRGGSAGLHAGRCRPLRSLIDEIASPGRGLVMVMGKGGVGKTTIAASIAAELASRGLPGPPQHHRPGGPRGRDARRRARQPEHQPHRSRAETKAYVDRVMANRGAKLDEAGRALLAEDLRSPCYEELAVFVAFSRIVSEARSSFVVLDTAPTGHTLLLLDATGSYHRQMVAAAGHAEHGPARIVTPLMKLRDPAYTKILLVTLAETTPVSEAAGCRPTSVAPRSSRSPG